MLWGSPHDYLPFFAPTRCMSRGASPRGYQWVPNPIPQPSSAPCTHPQREEQRQGSTQHYYFKAARSSSCFHPGSKQHLLSLSSWRAAQQQHPVPKAPLTKISSGMVWGSPPPLLLTHCQLVRPGSKLDKAKASQPLRTAGEITSICKPQPKRVFIFIQPIVSHHLVLPGALYHQRHIPP